MSLGALSLTLYNLSGLDDPTHRSGYPPGRSGRPDAPVWMPAGTVWTTRRTGLNARRGGQGALRGRGFAGPSRHRGPATGRAGSVAMLAETFTVTDRRVMALANRYASCRSRGGERPSVVSSAIVEPCCWCRSPDRLDRVEVDKRLDVTVFVNS